MLSHGSPLFKTFNSHLDFPVWSGRTSFTPQLGLRERNCAKKTTKKSQAVGTRLTESLQKLIGSLDLCWQEANGNEQMDRLERRSPDSDRQNNYPPPHMKMYLYQSWPPWSIRLIRHSSITRRGGKRLIHCCTTLCRGVLPDFPERWLLNYVIEVCD